TSSSGSCDIHTLKFSVSASTSVGISSVMARPFLLAFVGQDLRTERGQDDEPVRLLDLFSHDAHRTQYTPIGDISRRQRRSGSFGVANLLQEVNLLGRDRFEFLEFLNFVAIFALTDSRFTRTVTECCMGGHCLDTFSCHCCRYR